MDKSPGMARQTKAHFATRWRCRRCWAANGDHHPLCPKTPKKKRGRYKGATRAQARSRDGACVACGFLSRLTTHHVYGGGRGPWVTMCEPCHQALHEVYSGTQLGDLLIDTPAAIKDAVLEGMKMRYARAAGIPVVRRHRDGSPPPTP